MCLEMTDVPVPESLVVIIRDRACNRAGCRADGRTALGIAVTGVVADGRTGRAANSCAGEG